MISHSSFIGKLLASAILLTAASSSLSSQPPSSARDALVRFCDLDARGEQLSSAGWKNVAALFVSPGAPRRDRIIVVRDFVVSAPALEKDKTQFYAEYVELGQIDVSTTHFSPAPAMKVRASFDVVTTSNRPEQPAAWRIAGRVPEPHLSVDAAIRYATELRANASGVASQRNIDKLIADLHRLR